MLRIGLLGAAGIAPAAIIGPSARRNDTEVLAVAARSADAAAAYAATHSIPRSYGGYSALLADPDIDLVYNALPPSEHKQWTIAALAAGKDVLCEKPFAMDAIEAIEMTEAAAAHGRRLIEAFHDRYHPLSAEIAQVVATGRLGTIVSLEADFSGSNPFDPRSLRHDPVLGGGSLMDLGCYPVHWVRALTGEEPTVTAATATLNPLGADLSMDAQLLFPSGITARVTSSMIEGVALNSSLDVVGTRGTLRVDNMVFPSKGHALTETLDGLSHIWTVRGETTYDHQLEAVVTALASGAPLPTEGDDPIHNMQVIDAIYAAAAVVRPTAPPMPV